MSKTKEIADIVERKHPGLLEAISQEDNLTQEELIGKVLKISHGQMVAHTIMEKTGMRSHN